MLEPGKMGTGGAKPVDMPGEPKGEKRPAAVGNAVHVTRIASGEGEDQPPTKQSKEYARKEARWKKPRQELRPFASAMHKMAPKT
jgi:hypothetical protein